MNIIHCNPKTVSNPEGNFFIFAQRFSAANVSSANGVSRLLRACSRLGHRAE